MNPEIARSSAIAGVIAAVIWTVIYLIAGGKTSTAILWAVIFLVGGFIGTYIITTIITNKKQQ